ncbi:BtrH N-terminal domain-containing protein [Kineococcus endophyticus]
MTAAPVWVTGGRHCETTALAVLLHDRGAQVSEPLLFGLGAGLSFVHWDTRSAPFPFLGGRVKPFELTRRLAARTGLRLSVRETRSARAALAHLRDGLATGSPVGLQLDSSLLPYFTSSAPFPGHVVAATALDGDLVHLVDTAQQGGRVSVSLDDVAAARAARGPMSAPHRSFTLDVPDGSPLRTGDLVPALVDAVVTCAREFLDPPIANVGHRGLRLAAQRLPTWFDRVHDPARDLVTAGTLVERAGTGGGLFRLVHSEFLADGVERCRGRLPAADVDRLARGRDLYARAADGWTRVAGLLEAAGRQLDPRPLQDAGRVLHEVADLETAAAELLREVGPAGFEPTTAAV